MKEAEWEKRKKKSPERKEAQKDDRGSSVTPDTAPPDASPVAQASKKKHSNPDGEEGAVLRYSKHHAENDEAEEEADEVDPPHPPSPWPGRTSHDHVTTGKTKSSSRKHKEEMLCADPGINERRRASSDIPRGRKENGRAFWHRDRTPRRGILLRSFSEENMRIPRQGTDGSEVADRQQCKLKRHKKHSKHHNESVKFDRVVVRYYPREVCLGGCMLNSKHGPFLGTRQAPTSTASPSLSL